ncbi:MAG: UPF0182 family protein [Balneolaceae bacterium]
MDIRTLRLILILATPLVLLSIASSWIFELMWLTELGYDSVFWTLRGTQVILGLTAFFASALFLVVNARSLASRIRFADFTNTPLHGLSLNFARADHYKNLQQILTVVALLLALLFAAGFYIHWDASLRFLWNEPFGNTDPIFNKDIGFYLFQLPFWHLIQTSASLLLFFVLAALSTIYMFTGLVGARPGKGLYASSEVMRHLMINAGLWMAVVSWGFWLDRYQLLLKPEGIVFGAVYTDIVVQLPAIWALFSLTLLLSLLLFVATRVNIQKPILYIAALTVLILILGRGVLPGVVQTFNVEPNELELERPYLENNIKMTRMAWGLDEVREVEYSAEDTLRLADIRTHQDAIDNIRLWDPRLLIQTYRQLQEIRSYYEFYAVGNDRYEVDGSTMQMMLSAREIARQLPSQSDTWVNRRLQYTHGFGLVMNSVTEANRQGEPMFHIRDIPPVSTSPDLSVDNPAIYYGVNSTGYYIVNSEVPELHYPSGDQNVYINYPGSGGIPIDSFFRRIFFAWEMSDINILLSDYIHEESRLQIWRSVHERIRKITPFLKLDRDPYLVLRNGQLFWIQDAYTTSSHFPYSQSRSNINYIRNSVKIVVDAFEGTVDYYIADENDPVLQVYNSIFPGLFQSLDSMPEGLEKHFRYPQDLFELQIGIFNRYHMTQPQVFYNQEDLWTRPNEKYGGQQLLMEPYYVLARLPGESELEFMLISPVTPENRDNMIAWIAAKSDPDNYGDLVTYKLPKDRLIYGPAQIEARIDQDPEISRQIALWDQRGSSVIRGNLMVIPIENSFLYVEPVFLLADGVDIPQLHRVIVAMGDNISMQPTIEMAILDIFGMQSEWIQSPLTMSGENLPPILDGEIPEGMLQTDPQQLMEIRSVWNEIQSALMDQEWAAYGELLEELDQLIGED